MARHPSRAFTLIELLILVVILGILVAIAVPRFRNDSAKGAISLLQEQLRQAADAQTKYLAAHGQYAPDAAKLLLAVKPGTTVTIGGSGLTSGSGWNAVAESADKTVACYLGSGVDTVVNGVPVEPDRIVCKTAGR